MVSEEEYDDYIVIEAGVVDTSRWSIIYEMIFKNKVTNKYYQSIYSVGATDNQDEGPYEYEDDMIEVDEVKPVEVTIIQYRKV